MTRLLPVRIKEWFLTARWAFTKLVGMEDVRRLAWIRAARSCACESFCPVPVSSRRWSWLSTAGEFWLLCPWYSDC
jgi:hypothetical protein